MTLDITNVQPFSLHDGPGIRTTVFLAGCPLSCTWCHNPEARCVHPTLLFESQKCSECRACGACVNEVHSFDAGHNIDRSRCILCGKCVKECPSRALSISQRVMTEQEYIKVAERQARIVGDNGGITFSGGEPLMQGERFLHFLSLYKIHKAVETSGFADEGVFCRMLELADYVMLDLKIADPAEHKKYTGRDNGLILKNLDNLRQSGRKFILRTPMIPGITDTESNICALSEIVKDDEWERISFNPLTASKYERMGMDFALELR